MTSTSQTEYTAAGLTSGLDYRFQIKAAEDLQVFTRKNWRYVETTCAHLHNLHSCWIFLEMFGTPFLSFLRSG